MFFSRDLNSWKLKIPTSLYIKNKPLDLLELVDYLLPNISDYIWGILKIFAKQHFESYGRPENDYQFDWNSIIIKVSDFY